MRKHPFILAIGVYLGFIVLATHASAESSQDDLSYRSALYDYTLQQYTPARNTLLQAQQTKQPSSLREMLLARVYVEQGHYLEAQQAFASQDLDEVPVEVRNETLFALTRLYYAQNHCDDALAVLANTKRLNSAQDAQSRFIQATCIVQKDGATLQNIQKAERILMDGLKRRKSDESTIWFSYAFYNLAVAAANLERLEDADRLYIHALDYTGNNAEGRALATKIRLSRAQVNYVLNRYESAMSAYEDLPLNNHWEDQALLGYGWAAFRNYQSDIALEAWQQLINLPFKSMSVYQGYLVIPLAYERANALMQAIVSYDYAIDQYIKVSDDIDRFSAQLTLQKINDHAVRYHYQQVKGTDPAPIHPLLAATYTQVEFRSLVEKIGMLTAYKQQLANSESMLEMQAEYRQLFDREASQRQASQQQQASQVEQALTNLANNITDLVDELLRMEFEGPKAHSAMRKVYNDYQNVVRQAQRFAAGSDKLVLLQRLQRLQGVLLQELVQGRKSLQLAEQIHQVASRQQALYVRFNEYRMLSEQSFAAIVEDSDMAAIGQRIDKAQAAIDAQLVVLQNALLDKTKQALAEQRYQIDNYRNQAKIASANLKEDFYQRGGSRLWY